METIQEIVRKAEHDYVNNDVEISQHVRYKMFDIIQKIDAYLNSKHTSGETDSLGRQKPFFNICTSASNIWYRATELDRKNIRIVASKNEDIVLAFVANVLLTDWMNRENFGQFLNNWGRTLSQYGSSVVKFVKKDGRLIPTVVPWNRLIVDSTDFDALPRIEKFYMTPSQLRKMKQYDQEVVDNLITAVSARKTLEGHQQDNTDGFIELYEVHGEMDSRLLEDNPDLNIPLKDITYRQQMHVVSFVGGNNSGDYKDFTLYKGRESEDPYMITHLIEMDGRTLSIGAVEHLFDAQWMVNHTVKQTKDYLDLASKMFFQTSDQKFIGRNALSQLQTGDILHTTKDEPLSMVNNSAINISALQSFGQQFMFLGKEVTSTPDALRGNTMPSGTPYSLGALLQQESASLFELMTENKALALEQMMRVFVIPFLKTKMNTSKEIASILDENDIKQIDAMYVPKEAVRRYNEKAIEDILDGKIASPYIKSIVEEKIAGEMAPQGNTRFFKPSDISTKMWQDLLKDFEWTVRVEITNEAHDKQAVLATLSTVFQTIASNPMVLQDPTAKTLFGKIVNISGAISPLELTSMSNQRSSLPAINQIQQ